MYPQQQQPMYQQQPMQQQPMQQQPMQQPMYQQQQPMQQQPMQQPMYQQQQPMQQPVVAVPVQQAQQPNVVVMNNMPAGNGELTARINALQKELDDAKCALTAFIICGILLFWPLLIFACVWCGKISSIEAEIQTLEVMRANAVKQARMYGV